MKDTDKLIVEFREKFTRVCDGIRVLIVSNPKEFESWLKTALPKKVELPKKNKVGIDWPVGTQIPYGQEIFNNAIDMCQAAIDKAGNK